jgi:hypothetical protein
MTIKALLPEDAKEILRRFALNVWKQKGGGYYFDVNGTTHGPYPTLKQVLVEARREAEKQLKD